MSRPSPVNLLIWPVMCLAIIVGGLALNPGLQKQPWAWPTTNPLYTAPGFNERLALLILVIAVILLVFSILRNHRSGNTGTWFEGILPQLLFFTGLWIIVPLTGSETWLWAMAIALAVVTVLLLSRSRAHMPSASLRYYFSGANALPDALFVLLPLATGIWMAKGLPAYHTAGQWLYSMLLYPLYALLQLSVFLIIPATRMVRMGYSSRSTSVSCAVVFSLAHWPNPLLMAVTGIAMLVWASQFLKGRSILILALVMGLAATGMKLTLPRNVNWDLRIGPDYIEKRTTHSVSMEKAESGSE